jgi:hypothetical protein
MSMMTEVSRTPRSAALVINLDPVIAEQRIHLGPDGSMICWRNSREQALHLCRGYEGTTADRAQLRDRHAITRHDEGLAALNRVHDLGR